MNGLDLFSGIGGLSLALAPWVRPVAYCEVDAYARGVLLSRMQDGGLATAPIWDDVRTLRGDDLPPPIDIIYGGFPCQDLSLAGLRKGLDGERSGLFFHIMRLVDEVRPRLIFLENVPGIRQHAHRVFAELAARGFDARWMHLAASDVGAPHKRERWWCLAANTERFESQGQQVAISRSEVSTFAPGDGARKRVANTDSATRRQTARDAFARDGKEAFSSGPFELRRRRRDMADPAGGRHKTERIDQPQGRSEAEPCCAMGDADSEGQLQPSGPLADVGRWAGNPGWWSIEPDVGRVAHGVPKRVDRLSGLGNAVVPAQARRAFEILSGQGGT